MSPQFFAKNTTHSVSVWEQDFPSDFFLCTAATLLFRSRCCWDLHNKFSRSPRALSTALCCGVSLFRVPLRDAHTLHDDDDEDEDGGGAAARTGQQQYTLTSFPLESAETTHSVRKIGKILLTLVPSVCGLGLCYCTTISRQHLTTVF